MTMVRAGCAALLTAALVVTGCARDVTGTAVTAAGGAPGGQDRGRGSAPP